MKDDFSIDINPADHVVADAIGEPGNRTFFIQSRHHDELVNLVLDKHEVANLAVSILQLLEDLEEKYPELEPTARQSGYLTAEEPIDPTFRVGQLIVGYDESSDRVWLIAKALMFTDSGSVMDPDEQEVPSVRMVATREIMRAMSEHALEVVARGRPICPLCNRPINRDGHFCPRTDGHAMPVIF